MAVTSDPRATQAALEILQQGGNALDAAVAAQAVLNVVQPHVSGIGGSGYLLFYDVGTRSIRFFDGSVKAPDEAFPKMFLSESGEPLPYRERSTGGLAVGVPGLLKLLAEVHALYGTAKFPFKKLLDPAIQNAEGGVDVSASLAQALLDHQERLALFDANKKVFFKDGQALKEGQKFFQPDLANTFRLIQDQGVDAFYKGKIARAMVKAVQRDPSREGLLGYRDLEHYDIVKRDPVHGNYQGYDIFSAGPPSAGGVKLLRLLNLMSDSGVSKLGKTAETYHLLEEAQKLASPQGSLVADPDYFDVPVGELLSQEWAQQRAGLIKLDRVLPSGKMKKDIPERGKDPLSSSILIVDAQGNLVALSATLGDAFGSAVQVPDYGFFLNDQLTDFDTDPAAIQDPEASNIPASGQRPVNSAAPVFVFKEGKPYLILNAPGSGNPEAVLLNVLMHKIDFNDSCEGALTAPRVLDRGGVMQMESGLYQDEMLRLKLELLGHKVEKKEAIGNAQMVCFEEEFDKITGESDPRGRDAAAGL